MVTSPPPKKKNMYFFGLVHFYIESSGCGLHLYIGSCLALIYISIVMHTKIAAS